MKFFIMDKEASYEAINLDLVTYTEPYVGGDVRLHFVGGTSIILDVKQSIALLSALEGKA